MNLFGVEINKKLFWALVIIIGVSIICLIVKFVVVGSEDKYKVVKDKDYVYELISYKKSESHVPYINIDTDFAERLNSELKKLLSTYKNSTTSNNSISYRYNLSDDKLSLVLIFKSLDSKDQLQFNFKTYVFDLSDGARVLSDKEILDLFGVSQDDIVTILDQKMKKKYKDEVEKKILSSSECNYDCYLDLREISDFSEGINYYIENSKLVVYRSFQTYSIYQEEKYFTRNDFKFNMS